jgi:cell division transport system permease protein
MWEDFKKGWYSFTQKSFFLVIGLFVFFFIFISLVVILTSLNGSLILWQDKIKIYAFFPSNSSNKDILKVQKEIEDKFPILNINFIDQGLAWEKLKEILGKEKDIFSWGSPSNLPKTLEISLLSLNEMENLVAWLLSNPLVEDVKYSLELKEQWLNMSKIVSNLRMLFIIMGSIAYVIIVIELLAHSQVAYPNFSIVSQIFENFFTLFFPSLLSLISIYYILFFFHEHIYNFIPYIKNIIDLRHFILWGLFLFLSNSILSLSSAFIGLYRLKG